MSVLFWLLMFGGFSDNLLTDVGQESNFMPKFIVHGILSFSWFSILVIQSSLIKVRNVNLHKRLGQIGVIVFYGMAFSVLYLHFFPHDTDPLQLIFINSAKAQLLFGTILITLGFFYRLSNREKHMAFILFGTFSLMQPAIDRFGSHFFVPLDLFGLADLIPYLVIYLVLFGSFIWYHRKVTWYMLVWLVIWSYFFYQPFV